MYLKIRNIYILIKLLSESAVFAFSYVRANKLRTFLSLLGVTIGIFSIITVFTMVDALEENVRDGVESFGSNVIYIQRYPWTSEDGEYKWWEYMQRPSIKYEEFTYLQNHCRMAESIAFGFRSERQLKYGSNTTSHVGILCVTYDWDKISSFDINDGRYFSQMEVNGGSNVAIIGSDLAKKLFGDDHPIDKYFKIGGYKTRVIGLLKKNGSSIFSAFDYDNLIMVPYNYSRTIANARNGSPLIAIKVKDSVDKSDIRGEIKTLMRAIRRLKPMQKDNFAINEINVQELKPIMNTINLAGWIIGGFAILIGSIGVANIMFVSVKERTPMIGIQKSLGAKKYFIITQFLCESMLLTLMGGILGLMVVFFATNFISYAFDFHITLTFMNIVRGIMISAIAGILSGIIPAYMASRLNPVVAIGAK